MIITLLMGSLFLPKNIYASNPATLSDFWQGKATFGDEEEITFPGTPYNSQYDFYYDTHSSGMGVIADQTNPGTVYYFVETWKNNSADYLEPHIYKSTDGGKTFTHLTKLFDIVTTEGSCSTNSTFVYWNDQGKIWCLFQMREPDITYYNGSYYLIYESAARSGNEVITGPAMVKLSSLDIQQPITVQHGINFRQHPVFTTYDGNPDLP